VHWTGVAGRHVVGQLLGAVAQGTGWSTSRLDIAGHVLGLVQPRLLRPEADGDTVGGAGAAEEILVLQSHDAQQGPLAGAVAADDADLRTGVERQPNVLEYLPVGVGFAEGLDGEDVLFAHCPSCVAWGLRPGPARTTSR